MLFQNHSIWPAFQRSRWTIYPLLGFIKKKLSIFRANSFLRSFCKPLCRSHFGHRLLRRFKVTVAPETSQIFFACTAAAPSAPQSFMPSFDCSVPRSVSPSAGTASPPAASLDHVHQVKPATFDHQGNQSIKDLPPCLVLCFCPQITPPTVPSGFHF